MARYLALALLCASIALAVGQNSNSGSDTSAQLTTPRLLEDQQRKLFESGPGSPFALSINTLGAPSLVENAAARQLKGDKLAFPFLATLPNQGSAVYITALKPCGLILPHVHPRATEQYLIVSGTMHFGIAEEASGRSNVTSAVYPGQSFVVPQGLLHFNTNRDCTPLVFLQFFNSADPGAYNVVNALSSLGKADQQSLAASNAGNLTASPQGAFGLDYGCLAQCGLSNQGGGLGGLSPELATFLGVGGGASAPGASG